jgi:hypothetical protein
MGRHQFFAFYRCFFNFKLLGNILPLSQVFIFQRGNPARFLPVVFLGMGSSQAPYLLSEGFSNLISNSRRYLTFFIDFPFIAESQPVKCLIW